MRYWTSWCPVTTTDALSRVTSVSPAAATIQPRNTLWRSALSSMTSPTGRAPTRFGFVLQLSLIISSLLHRILQHSGKMAVPINIEDESTHLKCWMERRWMDSALTSWDT